MKIAVYTIAKNEEQFVQSWYDSAKEADYLLILDTGSTDNTVSLAKELGINVEVQVFDPWRFDNARNAALDLIPEDIDMCIALDMDEVIIEGWRQEVERAISDGVMRPRYEYTWSWKEDGSPGLVYGGDKVHKRHGYRWKHPVHEVLVSDTKEIQAWYGFKIHHHPDNTKPRSQYLPLLELSVQEDPADDRNAHYYARELFFYGDYEGATREFKRHLSLPRAVWKPERAASMRYLAKMENTEHWLLRAIAECPDRREGLVDLAFYYYTHSEFELCYAYAVQALKITEKPLEYICEESAWGWMPYDLAAIGAYRIGLYDKAIEYGVKAVELFPEDERLLNNLKWYNEKGDKA